MARLEGLLNDNPKPGNRGMGQTQQTDGSSGSLSIGQEVVNNQHMVLLGDKLLGERQLIAGALGKRADLCLIQIGVQHLGGLFFQNQQRNPQGLGCGKGRCNAGALNGSHLGDSLILEMVGKFLANGLHQLWIYLVVDKTVHLQNVRIDCLSLC